RKRHPWFPSLQSKKIISGLARIGATATCVLVQRELEVFSRGVSECGRHPAVVVVASCHEGLSHWCRSRRGGEAAVKPPRTPISAPGSALGSHLCVALSSVQAI